MAWIESHETLRDHPKLHEVCAELNASRPAVIGHLHLLWWWCINYALDGKLRYKNVQIARAAMWEGDADVFINALVSAGFIDKKNDELSIHDWMDFCGTLIDKRLERQEQRTRGSRSASKRRNVASKNGRLSPNRTIPTIPNHTEPTIPETLARLDGFSDAWSTWETARREMKKPLTDTARKQQFAFLEKQPDPVAVVNQSVQNQWRGLFELKVGASGANNGTGYRGRERQTVTAADLRQSLVPPGRTAS